MTALGLTFGRLPSKVSQCTSNTPPRPTLGSSDVINEDSYVANDDLGLFVVADGMGGHAGGEIASRTVADGVLEFIRATAFDPDKTWPFGIDPELSEPANRLQVAIRSANRKLADLVSADDALGGTGATMAAALFAARSPDRLQRRRLPRLSRARRPGVADHARSLVRRRAGRARAARSEDARHHPLRHIVTRAVSGDAGMSIDTWEIRSSPAIACCSARTASTRW